MGFYDEAKMKLDKGLPEKMDVYGELMKQSVHDALVEFCRQDEEFAQAVAQGGTFAACMKAVSGKVKNRVLSDLEAWGAAVKFYFPGAGIQFTMTIDLCADVRADGPKQGPVIDLSDFF